MKLLRLLPFIFTVLFLERGFAAAPPVVIEGPIWVDQFPSRNAIYSASALDLAANGYTEEEFLLRERAMSILSLIWQQALSSQAVILFKTRLIVRRPAPQAFNGIVVVEWINVTGGPDKDIDWWQSGEHLMRSGYAYVAVSAQQMGIDTMADWGSARYGELDMTATGLLIAMRFPLILFRGWSGDPSARRGKRVRHGRYPRRASCRTDHCHRSLAVRLKAGSLYQQYSSPGTGL